MFNTIVSSLVFYITIRKGSVKKWVHLQVVNYERFRPIRQRVLYNTATITLGKVANVLIDLSAVTIPSPDAVLAGCSYTAEPATIVPIPTEYQIGTME